MHARTLSTQITQRGAALLIILAITSLAVASLLLAAFNNGYSHIERENEAYLLLGQAKEALIGWATVPRGATLGQLPTPDALIPGEIPALNYDGSQNTGCVFSTWVIGNALVNTGTTLRCLGRLPWKTLGMAPPSPTQNDTAGSMLWYAVSGNLVDLCFQNSINPSALNAVYPGGYSCGVAGQLPYPWLTVRDEKGNILSNRVAAVVIMPGSPSAAQNRTSAPLAGPAAYLDALTVSTGCTAPCVPGTYNNAALNPGNVFIKGKDARQVIATDPNYAQPYAFNDKLIYITIDELMATAEKRAALEARIRLKNFFTAKNYYPFAATLGDATGACVNFNRRGFLPLAIGTGATQCTNSATDFLGGVVVPPNNTTLPAWFTSSNWQNFIYYTVAPACVPGTVNCSGAGLLSAGTIVNIRTLLIATGRPIINLAGQTPAMTAPPFAAKGSAQIRPSAVANDYLDSIENSNGNDIYDAIGTTTGNIYNDQMTIVSP
jgi:hypothetical protein